MERWRLQLLVAVMCMHDGSWEDEEGWQYQSVPVTGHDSGYILVETQRFGDCASRELLTAGLTATPMASQVAGLWHSESPWIDLEGWALSKSYHSLSLPVPVTDLY